MKITLITVCYNSAVHIADTLRSVDSQTWRDFEHLIIDGASTDGTLDIVRSFSRPWRRLISERDHGIYDAMNKGIALAAGDVVGFLNSDDFLASPTVLEQVAAAFADPNVDACYGDLCYVSELNTDQIVRHWKSGNFKPGMFLRGWCPAHPTFYVRRGVYERFGKFDLSYTIAADVELMARFLEVHRISTRYLPELLVRMRLGGTTNRSWRNVLTQNREIWRALRGHGLNPSLAYFTVGKLVSRGLQFLPRSA